MSSCCEAQANLVITLHATQVKLHLCRHMVQASALLSNLVTSANPSPIYLTLYESLNDLKQWAVTGGAFAALGVPETFTPCRTCPECLVSLFTKHATYSAHCSAHILITNMFFATGCFPNVNELQNHVRNYTHNDKIRGWEYVAQGLNHYTPSVHVAALFCQSEHVLLRLPLSADSNRCQRLMFILKQTLGDLYQDYCPDPSAVFYLAYAVHQVVNTYFGLKYESSAAPLLAYHDQVTLANLEINMKSASASSSTSLAAPALLAPPASSSTSLAAPASSSTSLAPPASSSTSLAPPASSSTSLAPPASLTASAALTHVSTPDLISELQRRFPK